MSKKFFKLWLDESGDFKNDRAKVKKGLNPSLIGGFLTEADVFGKGEVERIFPKEEDTDRQDFHATEAKPAEVFEKFSQIEKKADEIRKKEKFGRYVSFTNTECIMVIDDSITYQNIMAEGIMKVICDLKSSFGDIKLDVLIASRKNNRIYGDGQKVVTLQEYEQKLKEKIIMAGIHHEIKESEWTLEIASARDLKGLGIKADKRLMVADIICNCFLTKTTKFQGERSQFIESIYEDKEKTWNYPVLLASIENQFKELMSANRLGEAVAVLCQCDHPRVIEACMKTVQERIQNMQYKDIEMQYSFLKALFEHDLNYQGAYAQCEKILKNLLSYFVPALHGEEIANRLTFDLNFYLLTVYTHMGNVTAARQAEEACDEAFSKLPVNWDWINLKMKYENRKIINRINLFDYTGAKAMNEGLVKECKDMKALLTLYKEDIKYDELGKALGTQVQIETSLFRLLGKDYNNYKAAAAHSDEAVHEFISHSDICRQYLYRVQLETEAGQYDRAYKYLCLANGLKENAPLNELKKELEKENRIYSVCAYVRLMAEGKLGEWEMADEMYKVLTQMNVLPELTEGNEMKEHPEEIIFWKCASYKALAFGNISEYYKNAIEICFGEEDLTLNIIGLAIEFERYAFALKFEDKKEAGQYRKSLRKKYEKLYQGNLPASMKDVFGNVSFDRKEWDYYFDLSRKVTY